MTVSTTTSRVEYAGNGSTTAFSVPFYFLANGDLKVYQGGTLKTLTTHYTVSGAGNPAGGTVTFLSAPGSSDDVVIFRDPALTQNVDYVPNDPFPAASHEQALDRLTMIAQRLSDRVDRAFVLDDGLTGVDTSLPTPEASKLVGWNPAADALQNYDPADLASVLTYANWQVQTFTGDGSTTSFALTSSPVNVANTDVSIDGVTQVPGADYSLSGDGLSIVFGAAPGNGTVICCRYGQAAAQGRDDASIIYYLPAGSGAVSRSVQAKLRESVSVLDFGADPTGVADSTAAIQAALDATTNVYAPAGTYRVTASLILNSGNHFVGDGQAATVILSEVINGSLFKTTASAAAFIRVADMKLLGNGLTGASGNGHAINFIDPAIGSGSFTPQNSLLERLWITGFKGLDVCTNSASPTISSSAVIMYDTLAVTCRNLVVTNCGHGFYMRQTQNCRLEDCVVDGVTKYALLSYQSDNLILTRCDFIDAGDGVTEAGYPNTNFGSGIVVSNEDSNFVLRDSKIKNNRAGGQAIRVMFTEGAVIDSNWIRANALTDVQHKGIYAERCSGLRINNNTFDPSATAFSSTRKYEEIELYNSQTNEVYQSSIEGNVFGDVSGMDIAYNVKVGGNASTRSYQVVIRNNKFGYRAARSAACVVDADVVIASAAVRSSDISRNTHYAPTNVTRSIGYQATSATLSENLVGPNEFMANGGTITAEYSGLTESILNGSATYDPPNLVDGAGDTTTVTVTGAALGDYAEASFSRDLQGITVTAWVSVANTVSVRFQNETGGPLDLASGTLRASVRKA